MNFQTEIETLIRARYPILYVITSEEMRVQNILVEIAAKRQKKVFEWTYSSGIVPAGASIQSQKGRNPATKDPLAALDLVIDQVEPAIFLFKDFHPFLTRNNFAVIRRLKDIALHLKNSCKTIVLISPVMEIPAELDKEMTVINFLPPSKEDLGALLDKIIEDLRGSKQVQIELDGDGRERLLQAALGLTLGEAENVFAKIIVKNQRLSADHVNEVFAEKQQIIRKSGLLEYYATEEDFTSVGGLAVLKDWLNKRAVAFTAEAQAFGLPCAERHPAAGRAGLRQELVRQGGLPAVATAAAALRHGPHVRQPGRVFGGKRPARHRRGRVHRARRAVGGRD